MTLVVSPWLVQFSILFLVSLPFTLNLQYNEKGNKEMSRPQEGLRSSFSCYCCYYDVAYVTVWNDCCYWSSPDDRRTQHDVGVSVVVFGRPFDRETNDRQALSLIHHEAPLLLS